MLVGQAFAFLPVKMVLPHPACSNKTAITWGYDPLNQPPNEGQPGASKVPTCPGKDFKEAFVEGYVSEEMHHKMLQHMDECETCFHEIAHAMSHKSARQSAHRAAWFSRHVGKLVMVLLMIGVGMAALLMRAQLEKLGTYGNPVDRGLYEARMAMLAWLEQGEELRHFRLGLMVDDGMEMDYRPSNAFFHKPAQNQHYLAAVANFEEALAQHDSETNRNYLISMHILAGNYAKAREESLALRKGTSSPEAECYDILTKYLFEQRDSPEMLAAMKRLYQHFPNQAFIVFNSAAFFTLVKAPESNEAWQAFLKLEPKGHYADYARSQLAQNPF